MTLRLIREPSSHGATLGCLFVDGVFFSFSLEDPIREVAGRPVVDWKIKGDTAIPVGRYPVVVTMSPRFKRRLPLLEDVPGFEGIRIHAGNRSADSEGCILLGRSRGTGMVMESKIMVEKLITTLDAASGDKWIVIEPPFVE